MTTETFVDQLYEKILHRSPDGEGKSFWVNEIDVENVSAVSVTASFLNSPEFQAEVSDICKLYYAFFNRIPDNEGLNFWVNAARGGESLAAIADGFINSSEFINNYGTNLNDEAFIEAIYTNVLGRDADGEGLSFWKNALQSGTSRGELTVAIARSSEAGERLDSKVQATAAWYGILGRAPQEAELENAFDSLSLQIKALYTSSDYTGQVVPGITDDAPSITNAHYDTQKNELTLSGSGLQKLLQSSETAQTDISDRMGWDTLTWYMGRGDRSLSPESFSRDDVESARIESDERVVIQFSDEKAAVLEARDMFGSEAGGSAELDRLSIHDSLLGASVQTPTMNEITIGYDQVFHSKSYEETIIGTDGVDRFIFGEAWEAPNVLNWGNAKGKLADVSYVDVLAVTPGDRIDLSGAFSSNLGEGLDGLVQVQAGADITPNHAVAPFSNGEGGKVSALEGIYHSGAQMFESSASGSDLFVTIADQGDPNLNRVIVLTGTTALSDVTDGILTV